jgi:hypothetical protein
MPRGGYRPGAGRKVTGVVTKSKVVRVSPLVARYVDNIDSLLQLIKDWESESASFSPNSRDWNKARILIEELRQLFPDSVDSDF